MLIRKKGSVPFFRKRPILLTGSHRSGTTWVGKIISSSRDVGYIMEPFNDVNRRPGVFKPPFGRFFPYLTDEEKDLFLEDFENTLTFRYQLGSGLESARGGVEYARVFRDSLQFTYYRLVNFRPFVKDPNALLLAEWLHEKFDMHVVVMVRHPAAFISSLLKLNWHFPFGDYLKQPQLMQNYLSGFQEEILLYSEREQPLIDQAILVWKTLHHIIAEYKDIHDDWLFIKHEDLSRNPQQKFEDIYTYLNLSFDDEVQKLVKKYSNSGNPNDMTSVSIPVSSSKSIRRDSSSNILNWKKRLSSDQISYIRKRVEPVSSTFYSDNEW